jgi:DNA topoisomerase-1
LSAVRKLIPELYGSEYLPEKPNIFSRKKSAQDAHEAIRPTYLNPDFAPEKIKSFLTAEQFKLYNLIWKRFVASQMKPAKIDRVSLHTGDEKYIFETVGETVVFPGFLAVYKEMEEETGEQDNVPSNIPKEISENEAVTIEKIDMKQEFTKPPARYTESSLVKKLDQLGIGRPSTYATIISTLFDRNYVVKEEKKLVPTELGRTVNKILIKEFPSIFNVKFTAEMENELDLIERAEDDYLSVMNKFYGPFSDRLEKVEQNLSEIKKMLQEDAGETCELCGAPMVIKWGRHGRFKACSNYPECKNTKPLEESEPEKIGEKCPECEGELVKRSGRYGEFIACSNYPTCKYSRPITLGIKCPKEGCDGEVTQKRSRRGRLFYGCTNYPDCDFVSWYKPVLKECTNCGNNYLEERNTKTRGTYYVCPKCKTKYTEES